MERLGKVLELQLGGSCDVCPCDLLAYGLDLNGWIASNAVSTWKGHGQRALAGPAQRAGRRGLRCSALEFLCFIKLGTSRARAVSVHERRSVVEAATAKRARRCGLRSSQRIIPVGSGQSESQGPRLRAKAQRLKHRKTE